MQHALFHLDAGTEFKLAIIVPETAFEPEDINRHYVLKLGEYLGTEHIIAVSVQMERTTMGEVRKSFEALAPILKRIEVTHLLIANPNYFKAATGLTKVVDVRGYVHPSKCGDFTVASVPSHKALFHNPSRVDDINLGIKAIGLSLKGELNPLGADIIHSVKYYNTNEGVAEALEDLKQYEALTVDIEGYSLDYWKTQVATIAFAWDKHNGICIKCDWDSFPFTTQDGMYGEFMENNHVRGLLREFFLSYEGTCIYQNAPFDIKVLIYTLFMADLSDYTGLLKGLHTLTASIHDTKVITYLATNTTSGNKLGLKHNAYEFAGDYAEDVKDIRLLPLDKLMRYNVVDCLSTWYVYEKNMQIMLDEEQLYTYLEAFLPSIKVLIHTELNGLCIDIDAVRKLEGETKVFIDGLHDKLASLPIVHRFLEMMHEDMAVKACAKLKVKFRFIEEFEDEPFNSNSGPQKAMFLHDFLDLPILDTTKKGKPATGTDALVALKHHIMQEHDLNKEDLL